MQGVETKIACKNDWVPNHIMRMKESASKPDVLLMEYKYFFRILSYYLPLPALQGNEHFVNWLRNTPGLPYEFASEIAYILPPPRQQHYQEEFTVMRQKLTTRF
jgi:hypothetical protein